MFHDTLPEEGEENGDGNPNNDKGQFTAHENSSLNDKGVEQRDLAEDPSSFPFYFFQVHSDSNRMVTKKECHNNILELQKLIEISTRTDLRFMVSLYRLD